MRNLRTLLVLLTTAGAMLVLAGVASAADGTPAESITYHLHITYSARDISPCTGNAIDYTRTANIVNHVTDFPGSDEFSTSITEEAKVTGVDEGTGVVYVGHLTSWGGGHQNEQSSNWTFDVSFQLRGSDGSTISYHEVHHLTTLPSGEISVSFDKASLTCG
jgi:hypothetical protein